jgi:uncharacterized membrane protein
MPRYSRNGSNSPGGLLRILKLALLWAMALFYVVAGVNHFVNPDFYVNIMPPYLPWHAELVFLSGVAEVLLGLAVLVPATRILAAWGIIALLIAVFPANLHVALNDVPMLGSEQRAGWLNWVRLPFQGLLVAWAWWYTRAPQEVDA